MPAMPAWAQTNYYTYQNGSWGTAATWTTDPSGITSVGAAVPGASDNVTILNGYTITTDGANRTSASLTVNTGGFLYINNAGFAAHNFGTVSGQGTIRTVTATIGGTANYTSFLGSSGGTIQFEVASNFTLPGGTGNTTIGGTTVTQYRNLTLNLNAVGTIATMNQGNLTINGNLTITQGTFQINDATAQRCTLTVNNDVSVAANGQIRVGTGNPLTVAVAGQGGGGQTFSLNPTGSFIQAPNGYYHAIFHQFNVGGNFTNNGSVRFTNQTTRFYNQFAGLNRDNSAGGVNNQPGAVTVVFTGAQNNTVTCNGVTDFYNIVCNKGVDRTYVLTVNSTAYSNFELWGPVSAGPWDGGAAAAYGQTVTNDDPEMRKSLYIVRGTVRLQGNLRIWTMAENSGTGGGDYTGTRCDYEIGYNSGLWIDGAVVSTTAITSNPVASATPSNAQLGDLSATSLATSVISGVDNGTSWQGWITKGLLRISAGWFTSMNSAGGYIYGNTNAAQFVVNGGTVDFSQLSGQGGAGNNFAYIQTGGNVYLRAGRFITGVPSSNYGAEFGGRVPFDMPSTTSSFVFTGGQLTMSFSNVGPNMRVLSAAQNVNVTSSGQISVLLNDGDQFQINSTASLPALTVGRLTGTGGASVQLLAPLTLAGNLAINDNATLDANNNAVTIGGNFNFGTTTGGTAAYTNNSTTTMSGSGNSSINLANSSATPALTLTNLTIAENGGANADSVTIRSTGRAAGNTALRVTGNLTITTGDLNTLNYRLEVQGNIVNNDTITNTGTGTVLTNGNVLLTGTNAQTLSGTSGVYGNLQINKTGGSATLGSNMTLTGGLSLASATVLNAATYGVTLASSGGLIYGSSGGTAVGNFDATRMIAFNGNDSDGGVTYGGSGSAGLSADGTRVYPVGLNSSAARGARYVPVFAGITRTGTGTLTINPGVLANAAKLATLNGTFATNNALSMYWRLRTSGFTACTLSTASSFLYRLNEDVTPYNGTTTDQTNSWVFGRVRGGTRENLSGSTSISYAGPNPRVVSVTTAIPLITTTDSRFTVGTAANYTGTVKFYYTRQNGSCCSDTWSSAATWTSSTVIGGAWDANNPYQTAFHSSSYAQDGGIPGSGDIAVIGSNPSTNVAHVVFINHTPVSNTDVRTVSVAGLYFTINNSVVQYAAWSPQNYLGLRINVGSACSTANAVAPLVFNAQTVGGKGIYAVAIRPNTTACNSVATTNGLSNAGQLILSNADFGDFAKTSGSVFLYQTHGDGNFNGEWGPVNAIYNPPSNPSVFPNLNVYGPALPQSNGRLQFTNDVTINQECALTGGSTLSMNTGTNGDVTILGNLRLDNSSGASPSYKSAVFFDDNGTARNLTVFGDITLGRSGQNDSVWVYTRGVNTTTPPQHNINVYGNITLNSSNDGAGRNQGLLLYPAANTAAVNLNLLGTTNGTFSITGSGTPTPQLNNIVLNKGSNQTASYTFSSNANLNGSLTLTNGNLIMNNSSLVWNLVRTAAPADYVIPTTARLTVTAGTAQWQTTLGTGANLILNGGLTINGGTFSMRGNNTAEHSITYGSAAPTLTITSGTLDVGGAIRQPSTSLTGNLNYTQSGGTVTVGSNTVPQTDRGVFEIDNAGSAFNMSGGTLNLVRVNGSQVRPAFWMNPGSSSATGGTIQFGTAATPASQVFQVYSSATLPDVIVNTTNGPTARVVTLPLSVGTLTVQSGATFDAATNAQNVNISGNLTVNSTGTYNANNVTTTFNRSSAGDQTITNSGTMTFGSLTMNRSAGNNLIAASNFTVNQNLTLTQGSFQTGTNTITILGNVTNNAGTSGHVSGTSGGLLLQGSVAQNLGGTGTFGRVTVNNTQGVVATGNINIDGAAAANATFTLTNGIVSLGSNTFNLSQTAVFSGTFSNSRMVTTSGSGVGGFSKAFAAAAVSNYVFPTGTGTNYTPVTINIPSAPSAGGTITISPVIGNHPSAQSPNNVLAYYWKVTATGFTGVTGTLVGQWPATVNAQGTLSSYQSAQLQTAGSLTWAFGGGGSVTTADPRTATYTYSNLSANSITGDYTAGETPSLPNPQTYTINSGNWETDANWTPNPGTGSGPRGSFVVVNGAVTVTALNKTALTTTINGGGTISLGTTVGHNFGTVTGTGIIDITPPDAGTGKLPAGTYSGFTGTVRFSGSGNFTLDGATLSNNWPGLSHTGTGTMTLQSGTINVANTLTLGSSGNIDLATNNSTVTLQGNLVRSGTGQLGMNNTTYLTLNGTGAQNINTGAAPGLNVTNLRISKSSGATTITAGAANSPVNISNNLDLVNGILTTTTSITPSAQVLNFTNTANWTRNGASFSFPADVTTCSVPSSYINGAMMRTSTGNSGFIFPTGNSNNTSGFGTAIPFRPIRISNETAGQWVAYYLNDNNSNSTRFAGNITSVLTTREWWQVNGPNGGSANVTAYWGCNSAIGSANQTQVDNNFRVTNLNGALNWYDVASSADGSSTPSGGSVTTTSAFGFSIQSFGVGNTNGEPLPVTWLYFQARATAADVVALSWATASELNNDRFEIERSTDGSTFTRVGSVLGSGTTLSISTYSFNHVGLPANAKVLYYRIKQVDYDGSFTYSVVAEVRLDGTTTTSNQWAVGPNPYNGGSFNLYVVGNGVDWANDQHTIRIVGSAGNVVRTLSGRLITMSTGINEAFSALAPGIYFLRIESGSYSQTIKVVRQ